MYLVVVFEKQTNQYIFSKSVDLGSTAKQEGSRREVRRRSMAPGEKPGARRGARRRSRLQESIGEY